MFQYTGFQRIVAILVSVGLLFSSMPSAAWAQMFGLDVVHASSSSVSMGTKTPSESLESLGILNELIPPETAAQLQEFGVLTPTGTPNGLLLNSGLLFQTPSREPSIVTNPLTLSRIQSTYVASGLISDTLIITFTVTNNRPLVIAPELNDNATWVCNPYLAIMPPEAKNHILWQS